jgi:dephospho-CoA kinase
LAEREFDLIDADSVGHDVLDLPGVQQKLVDHFGPGVLAPRGLAAAQGPRVNRQALAAIVFADREARHVLEAIVHPLMRARFVEAIEKKLGAGQPSSRPVVLDAAILLEAGWDDLCDLIVFVDAPRDVRMRRVQAQRGWSRDVFEAREAAQWPCDKKRRRADLVITNDAGVDGLQERVQRILARLAEL